MPSVLMTQVFTPSFLIVSYQTLFLLQRFFFFPLLAVQFTVHRGQNSCNEEHTGLAKGLYQYSCGLTAGEAFVL